MSMKCLFWHFLTSQVKKKIKQMARISGAKLFREKKWRFFSNVHRHAVKKALKCQLARLDWLIPI